MNPKEFARKVEKFLGAATSRDRSELAAIFATDKMYISLDGFRLHAIERQEGTSIPIDTVGKGIGLDSVLKFLGRFHQNSVEAKMIVNANYLRDAVSVFAYSRVTDEYAPRVEIQIVKDQKGSLMLVLNGEVGDHPDAPSLGAYAVIMGIFRDS